MTQGQTSTIVILSAAFIFFGGVAWMVNNGFKEDTKNNRGGTRRNRNISRRK
jgi:hypothetical protein